MDNEPNQHLLTMDNNNCMKQLANTIKEFNVLQALHQRNETILKRIYYTMGLTSTIAASCLTFFSGLGVSKQCVPSYPILGLSFGVLMINTILNFGKIEEKMSQHEAMKIQYKKMILDYQDFITTSVSRTAEENEKFHKILVEKQKLLLTQEVSTCF